MKHIAKCFVRVLILLVLIAPSALAQSSNQNTNTKNKSIMKTYVIEREIPNAGKFTSEELKSISQTSCNVLKNMGNGIEWMHSYVTGNKIYCVYKADNEELIKEHAKKGGFPANNISEVATVISPETAN